MEPVYYGLFHSYSPALVYAVSAALATYGNVECEEWGAFVRVMALRRTAAEHLSYSRTRP